MKDAEIDDNNNNSEEDEEENETIGIEFTEQKANAQNDENVINFRWLDIRVEDEEDIAKANMIESLWKQDDEEIFLKRITGGLFNYYGIGAKEEK